MINTLIITQQNENSNDDSLLDHHYQELKQSGISDDIIRYNFKTIQIAREVDKILNRNTKRRWKHSENLIPGWLVSGIDPLTDEPILNGCQYKPDNPRINQDGKAVKYETPVDEATYPLFLRQPENDKWRKTIEDITTPIIITEGAKKAASGLSFGYQTIALPGVNTCRKLGRLHQDLLLFCKLGRPVYICFDNDILYKKQVYKALVKLAADLAYNGCKVFVIDLPPGSAKGMDDYLVKFGKDSFDRLIESASTFEEFKKNAESNLDDFEEKEIKSKLAINYHLINQRWGKYLAYNSLTKNIELHGLPLKEEEARLSIALDFDLDVSTSDAQVIIGKLSRNNTYSPVVDYLDEVSCQYSDIPLNFLDDLAYKFFGVKDEIYSIYFKNFIVSAVARARFPGCQVDHVFMLQSFKQGTGKSSFFRNLFGSDFFSDQLGTEVTNRDEKMKVSGSWCLEWAECDHVYKKKDVSVVKNFITNPVDTFRAPYARREESHPRPSVIVGTTNDLAPLRDPSGNRRFWITPVLVEKIPQDLVKDLRDKIWACGDRLLKSGYQYKLTDEQERIRELSNEGFTEADPWQETIENLLIELSNPSFISSQAITNELGFDKPKDVKGFDLVRIQNILHKLGFEKSKNPRRINGKQLRGWEKISSLDTVTDVTPSESIDNQGIAAVTTPVTPTVTPVTDEKIENYNFAENNPVTQPVTPYVTPHVTGYSQDISIVSKTVTPVTHSEGENRYLAENPYKEEVNLLREAIALNNYAIAAENFDGINKDMKAEINRYLTKEEQEQLRSMKLEYEKNNVGGAMTPQPVTNQESAVSSQESPKQKTKFKKGDLIRPKNPKKNEVGKIYTVTEPLYYGRVYGRSEKDIHPSSWKPSEVELIIDN